jgi:hypothetical protein
MEETFGPGPMQSIPQEAGSASAVVVEPLGTFGRAIRVELGKHAFWYTLDWLLSLAIHAAVLGTIAAVPYFFYQQLRPFAFTKTLLISPLPASATPAGKLAESRRYACAICNPIFSSAKLSGPIFAPRPLPPAQPAPPTLGISPFGVAGGTGNPLGAVIGEIVSHTPPPIPPSAEIIRVGGDLTSTRVIYGLALPYPPLAKVLSVTGHVEVEAVIDASGNVAKITRVHGPTLLALAAADAVAKEKFTPALLDGQPTACTLVVEVTFQLTR